MSCSNFETAYVSCGCNKTPHAADWGRNGLVCFASCHSVMVFDPEYGDGAGKIIHTLHGHTDKVTSVRWLKNFTDSAEHEMISSSADGTAILWSWNEEQNTYTQEAVLTGHTNIVNISDGIIRTQPGTNYERYSSPILLGTASVDSTVRIWGQTAEQDKVKCFDILDWCSGFCVDIKLAPLPGTSLAVLACAADDNNVHLFAETLATEEGLGQSSLNKFLRVHVLRGNEDWVRAMDFTIDAYNCLYLATGSQDTYIRVYKIYQKEEPVEKSCRELDLGIDADIQPEEKVFTVQMGMKEVHFSVLLETILAGHEGWVYGVAWHPLEYQITRPPDSGDTLGGTKKQKLKLVSTSMDKTLVIWSPDVSGVWLEEARMGEVGGNTLGFYGGKFGNNGRAVMAHGYQGSFHIWRWDSVTSRWEPSVIVGGHTDSVTDMAWDPRGNFLVSVGNDQTARLHAPWVRDGSEKLTWHELARPQIHGYDLSCVAMLSSVKYVSGAEEKVVRAFSAPTNFIDNLRTICKVDALMEAGEDRGPQGAAVPALGLSNKPVFEDMKADGECPEFYFSPLHLTKPPTEEDLLQNTLWPEVQKLYGHGYEVYAVAARPDGVMVASASKATTQEHAAIILWNAKTWLQIQKLVSHTLTVTQLSFSPDGKSLLSVSRDRRWSVFNINPDGRTYTLEAASDGKAGLHTRIIWTCAWTADSTAFATGSRDGKIGFWLRPTSKQTELLTSLDLGSNMCVTALAFAPVLRNNFNILAVGFETGAINLYKYQKQTVENLWINIQDHYGHHLTVKRLAFRPLVGRTGVSKDRPETDCDVVQLASCGQDHIVRVYDIFLQLL